MLLGYSGGGNSFTFSGLLDTLAGYLPAVEITVIDTRTYLMSVNSAKAALGHEIRQLHKQRPTPANNVSSQAPSVVTFEALLSDRKYGMLLDIARGEVSETVQCMTRMSAWWVQLS